MIVSKGRLSSLLRSRRSSGAKDAGFQAMRFNALVDTNTAAIRPWESLGSPTIDTVPQAFDSATRVGPAACHAPPLVLARHTTLRTPPTCVLRRGSPTGKPVDLT